MYCISTIPLPILISFILNNSAIPLPPPKKKAIVRQVRIRVLTVTLVSAVWTGHLQSGSDRSNAVQNAPFMSGRKQGKIFPFTLAFCYRFQQTM